MSRRDETEPHFPHECQRVFDLALDFAERMSGGEKIGIQVGAAIGGVSEVSGPSRLVESAPQENGLVQGLRPMSDMDGEDQVDARAEAVKPTLLHQIQAKLAEANPAW